MVVAVVPDADPVLLDAGGELAAYAVPIGVLQCATEGCDCRVTGASPFHCCNACAEFGNTAYHDELCLQVPLAGYLSEDAWCAKGSAERQRFSQRLRALLEEKGPLHLSGLPHAWDALYGAGNWASVRPVRSARKACAPPYVAGVKVLDNTLHAVEEIAAEGELKVAWEADEARLKDFTLEAMEVIEMEFHDATMGYKVSTSVARTPGTSIWVCTTTRSCYSADPGCEAKDSEEEGASTTESEGDVDEAPISAVGYGKKLEDASFMSRVHLLEQLGRWWESPDDRLLEAAKLAKRLQAESRGMLPDAEAVEGKDRSCSEHLQALERLADMIGKLLLRPPRCHAACWTLLSRIWPRLLVAQDTESVEQLMQRARASPKRPCLDLWIKLAEVAMWSTEYPALELLEDLEPEETQVSMAAAYAKHHLFSLLLEQREQLTQEIEKQMASSGQPIRATWGHREESFSCNFAVSLKGKADAVLLRGESLFGEESTEVICEVQDDSRALVRACITGGGCALPELVDLMSQEFLQMRLVGMYATVGARLREAVRQIVPGAKRMPYRPALRGAIIDTWAAVANDRTGSEELLRRGAELAGSLPGEASSVPGETAPEEEEKEAEQPMSPTLDALRDSLTSAQSEAVKNALTRTVSLVRGPPGTGKTHVAAAIAFMAAAKLSEGERVLAVSQSHAAALNLHSRLESFGARVARVGSTLLPHEVTEQVSFQAVKEYWGEDDEEVAMLLNCPKTNASFKSRSSEASSAALRDALGAAGIKVTDLLKAQFAVMRRMARFSDVVVMTCASSGNAGLLQGMGSFPLLVLDEAAQCVEPGPLVPLSWGSAGLALVGDEKQLPATILSRRAESRGLGVSLFERFKRDDIVGEGRGFVQLDEQRRMHPSLVEFPSHHFYDGSLRSGAEMAARQPVPGFPWPVPGLHLCFVECGPRPGEEGGRRSHSNAYEAEVLVKVLSHCLAAGVSSSEVGIITGYSAQQALLQRAVSSAAPASKGLRVDTVDGFQGAERDLILASTVRSSYSVGFMRDPRRINVLLTRARRGLIVFGHADTLRTEVETWGPWIAWVEFSRAVVTAEELLQALASASPEPESAEECEVIEGRQQPSAAWVSNQACAQQDLQEAAEAAAVPHDEWIEYVDPDTDKIWLYNEATGDCRWKD